VIANQYTKPGANPTIKGIQTGHPSAGTAMLISVELILFKSILDFSIQNRSHTHSKEFFKIIFDFLKNGLKGI
jgi:hypothetical protein